MADEGKLKEEKKDAYLEELVSKASKENQELSQDEVKKILEESSQSVDFLEKLKDIDLGNDSYRVIFTDGQEQLLYDDGEFFEISTVDAKAQRKKIGKKDAREKYIEYFIKYVLNPMIKGKDQLNRSKTVERQISDSTTYRTKSNIVHNKEKASKDKDINVR